MSPLAEFDLTQTAFRGMRDSFDPSASELDLCYLIRNAAPTRFGGHSSVTGRPGFSRTGAAGGERGGSAGNREVQWVGQFTKLDGTEYTLRIVGGLMDKYNWSTDAWTNVPLAGAGVALPTSGRVYATVLADTLIVNPNDGTTKPWRWDGTTFTSLTNAPTLRGPITVYYAKVFGVKNANRNVLVWSEENDPATGYEAGGFNNAWTLGQTDQEAVQCLMGTNEALYYWRERSIGAIRGAVTTDFRNDGVREGVSETIGTASPAAAVSHEREIYFLDADARPWVLNTGGALDPLWSDIAETALRIPRSNLSKADAADSMADGLVLLAYQSVASTQLDRLIAIDPGTRAIAGLWDGFTFGRLGIGKDGNGVLRLLHGSENGYIYRHGTPDEAVWSDTNHADDGGTKAIEHEVSGPALGYDTRAEKAYLGLDLSTVLYTDLTNLTVDYETPNGQATTALTTSITGALALWDTATWDTAAWSDAGIERKVSFGWQAYGRWVRPRVRHKQTGERFNLAGWTVSAVPTGRDPTVR